MAVHKIDGGPGGQTPHYPKKFVTLYAAAVAAIAKGDWGRLDLTDTTNGIGMSVEIAPMATAAGDPMVFGVATHAIAINTPGNLIVQTAGFYGHPDGSTAGAGAFAQGTGAAVEPNVAAGSPLASGSAGAAGEAMIYASVTHTASNILGVAVEAEDAGNYLASETGVFIFDKGLF